MLVKALREGLGRLIVFTDYVTRPKPVQRSAAEQARVDAEAAGLSLYQFHACPFCVKTRRAIHRLNLPLELRDAQKPGPYREQLEREGGKRQVPCLRIEEAGEVRWLYESAAIIDYLERRFDPQRVAEAA
jgi:glutaredoxin